MGVLCLKQSFPLLSGTAVVTTSAAALVNVYDEEATPHTDRPILEITGTHTDRPIQEKTGR